MIIKVKVLNNTSMNTTMLDNTETLRAAFEAADIEANGMITLDGKQVGNEGLDKTFEDFGIVDKCTLASVSKATNAVAVKITGKAAVFELDINYDELETIAKYNGEALDLTDDDGDVLFTVQPGKAGSIGAYGAVFERGHDGKAQITLMLDGSEDLKKYVADRFGNAIAKIGQIEAAAPEALGKAKAFRAGVEAAITVG